MCPKKDKNGEREAGSNNQNPKSVGYFEAEHKEENKQHMLRAAIRWHGQGEEE
jgi:hypothetical protein